MIDPSAVRFRPPAVTFTPELRWVLLRAFGPREHPCADTPTPAEALRTAESLQLAPRIAARIACRQLEGELDQRSAERFRELHRFTTALALQQEELARRVAGLAAARELPLIFLKGMALQLDGTVPAGSRRASDVDVLVPADQADAFHRRLQAEGFQALELPPGAKHLPSLRHGNGIILELHTALDSVLVGGEGSPADAACLVQSEYCRAIPGWPGNCLVPARDVTVAALLVHAIAQHGHTPAAYPMIRLVADLIDLGFGEEGAGPFLQRAGRWIARDVSAAEAGVTARLCTMLAAADERLFTGADDDSGSLVMLRHMVAGALDRDYRQSLRLTGFINEIRRKGIRRRLREVFILTPGQMEVSFGSRGNRMPRPLLLLWRPFQLAMRLALHAWRHLAYRWRSGHSSGGST